MIERRPELVEYAGGMPGGPDNPLGARALYLFDGNRDTMFRIHGTNEPWSIGGNVSSGCIRMLNEHVSELARMVHGRHEGHRDVILRITGEVRRAACGPPFPSLCR